jgi:hypothetical protein
MLLPQGIPVIGQLSGDPNRPLNASSFGEVNQRGWTIITWMNYAREVKSSALWSTALQKGPGVADRLLATIYRIYPQFRN